MKMILLSLALLHGSIAGAVEFSPNLIGGSAAQKGDFPEIVYIRSGNARCSATVIGPQVILTAAHCVADQGSISQVDFIVDQIVFQAKCEQTPEYRDNTEDLDFALCKTDKVIDVAYASVAQEAQAPKVGDLATLSGYGCTIPGGTGGNDGILRVGLAKIIKLPSEGDNWFYTQDKAAVCFGDSGGPAFKQVKVPAQEKHYVMGVNSRGNIKDLSLLTALWLPKSQAFFQSFAKEQGVDICGVTKDCAGSGDKPPRRECAGLKAKYDKAKAAYEQCQAGGSSLFGETILGR